MQIGLPHSINLHFNSIHSLLTLCKFFYVVSRADISVKISIKATVIGAHSVVISHKERPDS